ncbi:MAG TPA: aspartate--tRNA ligase [Cyclobacteriaceae bacterium]|nr:aspartate--tRNA ligase [Cyclobacteriaceae bacterium]
MLRTHTCGELRGNHAGMDVVLTGWAQRIRDKGGMIWIDLRDRYGITQLMFDESRTDPDTFKLARSVGREYVIRAAGKVTERFSKNDKIGTGDIEIFVNRLEVLNPSRTPPFTIEEESDGGDDLRMKYRYLDLRREPLKNNLTLRHNLMQATREYLVGKSFIEIETPFLIKSTPEGARDFVVPSRMNPGEFYALPQSPQTFKQLLMVAGFDRYFQIVRCFRDEDLRADRQPEFTQIDCELSFITQEDILQVFEGLVRHLFEKVKGIKLGEMLRMPYDDAMKFYGSDKPDIRFGMKFVEIQDKARGKGFNIFDSAELVAGICVKGRSEMSRKELDELTEFIKRPQVGGKGLVYIKYNPDSTFKSSIDKFYSEKDLETIALEFRAEPGDLLLIMAGKTDATRKSLCELRLKMGDDLGLRKKDVFAPLWVVDFPLFEYSEETRRYYAKHHPFTSPRQDHIDMLLTSPAEVKANAYDMVLNGVELGGGSIRIHDRKIQQVMFTALGLSEQEAREKFGFLMDAFEYGAPPHGGIAFGFDRLCAIFNGADSIRDFIAFPKNNSGRDTMIDTPSSISVEQLDELNIALKKT